MRTKTVMYQTLLYILFVCAILFATPQDEPQNARVFESRDRTTETFVYVDVALSHGAIYLEQAPADKIFEGEFGYANQQPEIRYEIIGETGRLNIKFDRSAIKRKGEETSLKKLSSLDALYENECRLNLSAEVPMILNLDLGVIKGELNLGGLKLQEIRFTSGVSSKTNIDFNEPNPIRLEYFDVEAGVGTLNIHNLGNANFKRFNFEGGIGAYIIDFGGQYFHQSQSNISVDLGKITLYLPNSAGVRMKVDKSFLSSFDIDEIYKENDFYHNEQWGRTSGSLDMNIEAGIGRITVVWSD